MLEKGLCVLMNGRVATNSKINSKNITALYLNAISNTNIYEILCDRNCAKVFYFTCNGILPHLLRVIIIYSIFTNE